MAGQAAGAAADGKIPRSVQLGLRIAREWAGIGVRKLTKRIDALKDRRFLEEGHTHANIIRLEAGEIPLKYGYLEALARTTGVTSGVLLSCTRAMSEIRNGKFDNALQFAAGLEQLALIIKARAATAKTLSPAQQTGMLKELFDAWKEHGLYEPDCNDDTK